MQAGCCDIRALLLLACNVVVCFSPFMNVGGLLALLLLLRQLNLVVWLKKLRLLTPTTTLLLFYHLDSFFSPLLDRP